MALKFKHPVTNMGETHLPLVLLLDGSYSLHEYEEEVNDAANKFLKALQNDKVASGRVDLAVVRFDEDVEELLPFGTVSRIEKIPHITCDGSATNLHQGLKIAKRITKEFVDELKELNTSRYRPLWYVITDGAPTDPSESIKKEIISDQVNKHFSIIPILVGQYSDGKFMKEISNNRTPLVAKDSNFDGIFEYLSTSISEIVHNSNPGDKVVLPDPEEYGLEPYQIEV